MINGTWRGIIKEGLEVEQKSTKEDFFVEKKNSLNIDPAENNKTSHRRLKLAKRAKKAAAAAVTAVVQPKDEAAVADESGAGDGAHGGRGGGVGQSSRQRGFRLFGKVASRAFDNGIGVGGGGGGGGSSDKKLSRRHHRTEAGSKYAVVEADAAEVVDLHSAIKSTVRNRVLQSSSTQTEPVQDEAFDWDLSDRADTETQTRSNSSVLGKNYWEEPASADHSDPLPQDALVQTDQRLVFLLRRARTQSEDNDDDDDVMAPDESSKSENGNKKRIRYHDAWSQTFVEVQEIGVQVNPDELEGDGEGDGIDSHARPVTVKARGRNSSGAMLGLRRAADIPVVPVPSRPIVGGFFGESSHGHVETDSHHHIDVVVTENPRTGLSTTLAHAHADGRKVAAEFSVVSFDLASKVQGHLDDSFTTNQSADAGFQVNLASDAAIAVADKSARGDILSAVPIGTMQLHTLGYEGVSGVVRDAGNKAAREKTKNGGGKGKKEAVPTVIKMDVAVQTENDIITDENPLFRAVPTTLCKWDLLGDNPGLLHEVDLWVADVTEHFRTRSVNKLSQVVKSLLVNLDDGEVSEKYRGREDLIKVRAFFRWIAENIVYDSECLERDMSTQDILRERRGVCRQFVKIFEAMCAEAGVRCKNIKGFAKGDRYVPGTKFIPGESSVHAWNAVLLCGSWRLVDCTWGAGHPPGGSEGLQRQKDDEARRRRASATASAVSKADTYSLSVSTVSSSPREINEHFFLPNPDELMYSHFPYDEVEANYNRWQLMDKPISLGRFNALPHLTPAFFEYSLRLDSRARSSSPLVAGGDIGPVDVNLWAWEVVRYKYKFYKDEEHDTTRRPSDKLNNYVFCFYRGRQRKHTVFRVNPPEEGAFFLKIYAKPEEELNSEDDTLDHVATLRIQAPTVPLPPSAWPRKVEPWGATNYLADSGAVLVSQSQEPVMVVSGTGRKKIVLRTPLGPILSRVNVFDADGNELVQDIDREIRYTVLLNKKIPLPSDTRKEEESSLAPFVDKKESGRETIFYINNLPKPGLYKAQIFARRKPKKRGKLLIPLVACILLEYRSPGLSQGSSKKPGSEAYKYSEANGIRGLEGGRGNKEQRATVGDNDNVFGRANTLANRAIDAARTSLEAEDREISYSPAIVPHQKMSTTSAASLGSRKSVISTNSARSVKVKEAPKKDT